MRRWLASLLLVVASPAAAQTPALLPTPTSVVAQGEGFVLAAGTPLVATDAGGRNAAARLAELMASSGIRLGPVAQRRSGIAIRFVRQTGLPPEGYRLTTSPTGATVTASDDAGLLYGAVTLWQLATQGRAGVVSGITVTDKPRFGWRGLMLDSARHFQSPKFIRRLLDWMAAHKLNRLHWHLVDDQGWRLPVPTWPKLTGVSAWRRPATAPGAPLLPAVGGFYSEADIRGIVAYAAARGITVVPEIEMPGHALAAIRAYPELGMGVVVPPGTEADWGVFPWLYNTDEPTFRFLQDVLAETMRLFPSRYIHVGGDEAVKDQWRASPAIQAQIRRLGLEGEDALQGWFMARIGRYLAAHGRKLIGWDEILEGGVPADATITSWRGVAGAVTAAKLGHDAILSPDPVLYLNNRQGTGPNEPPGRGTLVTLANVLAFDPIPAALAPAERRHVLGLQGNLWTEHTRTEERAAWMLFPRAAAVAEIGWAAAPQRDAATFARALVPQLDRLRPLGLAAADSAFAVTGRIDRRSDGGLTATLANQLGLPIRYTLDGSAPGGASTAYVGSVALKPGQRLRAASLLDGQTLAGGYDQLATLASATTRTSRELTPCSAAVLLDLEDDYPAPGDRAHFLLDIFNPCWRWNGAPVAGARRIALSVGQVPFNFQVGADREKIRFRRPATSAGEFEVRAGCEGEVVATLPLAPAISNPGVTRLETALSTAVPSRDLCITYTARGVDPLWAIDRVELLP